MSYIVPGKFPTSCSGCHLFNLDDRDLWCIANHYAGYCRELSKYIDEDKFVKERHLDCPLTEVPTPHGRLIDADKMMMSLEDWWYSSFGQEETEKSRAIRTIMDKIEQSIDVMTVIEEEREK